MRRSSLLTLPALLATSLAALWDVRASSPEEDFARETQAAKKAFDAGHYPEAIDRLQTCITLANRRFRDAVIAALPKPPVQFVAIPPAEPQQSNTANPMAAALTAVVGMPVEQRWRAIDGSASLRVRVLPNNPAARPLARAIASVDPESETRDVLELGPALALLERREKDLLVRVLVGESHVVEFHAMGVEESAITGMLDAQFARRIAAVLGP